MLERYAAGVVAELEGLRSETRKVTDEELVHVLERLKGVAYPSGSE